MEDDDTEHTDTEHTDITYSRVTVTPTGVRTKFATPKSKGSKGRPRTKASTPVPKGLATTAFAGRTLVHGPISATRVARRVTPVGPGYEPDSPPRRQTSTPIASSVARSRRSAASTRRTPIHRLGSLVMSTPIVTAVPQATPTGFFRLVLCEAFESLMRHLRNPMPAWDFQTLYQDPHYNVTGQNIIFTCVFRPYDLGHHLELLKFFHEEHDVKVDLHDSLGQNALFYACKGGHEDCAEYLLVTSDALGVNSKDQFGETPLFYAVRGGHVSVAKLLLEEDADIAVMGEKNRTVLMEAARCLTPDGSFPDSRMVKILLEQNASLEVPASCMSSPLIEAAHALCQRKGPAPIEDFSVINALLTAKADVNWRNPMGESVLSVAVRLNMVRLVEKLLQNGADGDARNARGEAMVSLCGFGTPMASTLMEWQASSHEKRESRCRLDASDSEDVHVAATSSTALVSSHVPTPAKRLLDTGRGDSLRARQEELRVKRARTQPAPFRVVETGSVEEIKRHFAEDHADPHQMDDVGQNIVHQAAKRKSDAFEVCQYLVERLGAHANFCDNELSWNPLFHAVTHGNDDCVEFLVENKCDPNHTDKNGTSVILLAVKVGSAKACRTLLSLGGTLEEKHVVHLAAARGHAEVLQMLLERQADLVDELDDDSLTPLQVAKNPECVEILLDHGASLSSSRQPVIFSHIRNQRADVVRFLLKQNCDVETTDTDGRTCLLAAIEQNCVAICRVLLEFNPSLAPVSAGTPEKRAAALGHTAITALLRTEMEKRKEVEAQQERNDLQLLSSVSGSNPLQQIKLWIEKYRGNPKRLWTAGKMETLLFAAASRTTTDVLEVVQYLMDEHGLLAGFVNLQGETALFNAVSINTEDNFAVAKLLVERNCDPNQTSSRGVTALFEAVDSRNMRCVDFLLEQGVDIKHLNNAGENVLFAAKTVDMLERLINAGADATIVNAKGRNCLFGATTGEMVELLLAKNCTVDCVDEAKENCLFTAVKSKQVTELLLKHGANVRQVSSKGQTCLHCAVEQRSEECARMLVEAHTLDPFLLDSNDCSPMTIAEKKNLRAFVQFVHERQDSIKNEQQRRKAASKELNDLLWNNHTLEDIKAFVAEREPSFEWRTPELGQTHIFFAVYSFESQRSDEDAAAIVEYLLDLKVDPTVCDNNGQSALYYACRYTGLQTCRLLIERKCDVNVPDLRRDTPLSYAARRTKPGRMDVVNLLLNEKADPNIGSDLFKAAEGNDTEMAQTLVFRGSTIEQKTPAGKTALFAAVALRTTELTSILMQAGADVNAVDNSGETVLFACSVANVPLVVQGGADVNRVDLSGRNALFSDLSVAKLDTLVQARCDVNHRDSSGRTCLFTALENGRIDVCERLIHDYLVCPDQLDAEKQSCVSIARESGDQQEFLGIVEALERRRAELERVLQRGTAVQFDRLTDRGDLKRKDPKTGRHYGFIIASRNAMLPDTVELLKMIANANVDLMQKDSSGQSCLFAAAKVGNINAMRHLIDVHCNVNDVDNRQRSPLFEAALGGDVMSFKFLLANSANAQARSETLGECPLFDAIRSGKKEMVQTVLRASNAEVALNEENRENFTPIREALRTTTHSGGSILELLLDSGAKVNMKMRNDQKSALFFCESPASCSTLLAAQADVRQADVNGRTALFDAVARRNSSIVDILVANNAQLNARDAKGRTAVFQCLEEDDMDAVLNNLVDLGADLNSVDMDGNTPLTLAKANKKRLYVATLKKRMAAVAQPPRQHGTNWAVRLTPSKSGEKDRFVITFYDPEDPDVTIPYASEEYKACWQELNQRNPELLGSAEYPKDTPWYTSR